ncbi:fimbria/pilus outer membrane usher protein [Pseudomonas sp. LB3P14]
MALHAEEVDHYSEGFNTSFLQGGGDAVDVQTLLSANQVLPGSYRVDLYSNEILIGRRDIQFKHNERTNKVDPCLTFDLLQQLGVDLQKLQDQGLINLEAPAAYYDLPAMIDQAAIRYDSNRLRLYVSVPQVALARGIRGYVDPELWDGGVPAGFINYQFSTNRQTTDYGAQVSNNLGLRNGVNLGAWRLRNESNFSTSTGSPNKFTSNRSYVQHDVTVLKGQFSAGEILSDTELFDSVRYQGVKLASDEGMRADSERGYAPIIRGVAESNATVEIRQDDYILYTTTVPPGPFEISDIYPTGSNGDLEIITIEADGRRKVSRQAFSALPTMVREGQVKYSASAGKYASNTQGIASPAFTSSTVAYGLSSSLTGIAGLQISENFQALSIGAAKNTTIGAISFDVTKSSSHSQGRNTKGSSIRALYAKTFTGTDTSFTLAAYRYSTEGYRSFNDHVQDISEGARPRGGSSKIRTDLTVNQTLGGARQYGTLYLNASDQRYWNRGGSRSFSSGYSNNWGDLNYNLSLTKTQEFSERDLSNADTQVNLSVSFPLGSGPRSPRAFVSTNREQSGNSTQIGINGYLSDNSDTFFSVQSGDSDNNGGSSSISVNTRTAVADLGVGYSKGRGYDSQNLNVSGSVVAHAGGVNFGQTVGETFALVEVPGISGVEISTHTGVMTGSNGYAVIPNAQPYRVNWLSLDTRNLGGDIELDNTSQQLVPRRGAVIVARFDGRKGRRVQFELIDANNESIPFGAALEDASGKQLAISDPTGNALAMVERDNDTLTIKWAGKQCQAAYSLPPPDTNVNYERYKLICLPSRNDF